jgi:hypothetical protein
MGYRGRPLIGDEGLPGRGHTAPEAACVNMVTLTVAAADPFIGTEAWLTEQVASAGAPLQLRVTDWLKPP